MKMFFIICLLAVVSSAFSQDSIQHTKWKYFGLHQVGLVSGSMADNPCVLTTNGISKGNWYTGISIGIDWYGVRSIPVMVGVYKAFGKSHNQPYLYGNAGISFPWQTTSKQIYGAYGNASSGLIAEGGVGYFIYFKNKTALTLSAGFSYKAAGLTSRYTYPINDKYDFHFRRVALRLGLRI